MNNGLDSNIIAVEGVCSAGKTTLIESLAKLTNLKAIPEATTLVPNFPPPPMTIEGARRNEVFCLQVEKLRSSLIRNHQAQGSSVLLDRSVVSVLCISYGYSQKYGISVFRETAQSCIRLLESNEITSPYMYVYLDVPLEKVYERNLRRHNALSDFWINEEALTRQQRFYSIWLSAMPANVVCKIDASLSSNDVLQKTLNFLSENISYTPQTELLRHGIEFVLTTLN